MKPKGGAERQTGFHLPSCSSRGWGCREQYPGVTGNQPWNFNCLPKCSPSSRLTFHVIVSVWGHKRLSRPQKETWEASHSPWTWAPRKWAQLSLLSKQPQRGIQSAWGFPVWKCQENNAPGSVWGGGLPLVRSPGEQLHVDREFQRVLVVPGWGAVPRGTN